MQSVTDAAGQVTSYTYDLATRTNTVTQPDGGTVVTVNGKRQSNPILKTLGIDVSVEG